MGLRVGTDLVEVEEVTAAIAVHGDRYLTRVYTAREIAECTQDGTLDPARLAVRFAAKEAVVKILAPATEALPWTAIEIWEGDGGAPVPTLSGAAADLAAAAGLSDLRVSVARERAVAAATAVAQVACQP